MPSSTGETLTIYNPKDDTLVSDQCQSASEADVDAAVKAAQAAFPAWKRTAGLKRGACMYRFADLLETHRDRIASLEGRSMGQPLTTARNNINTAIEIWRYYAGLASRITGESIAPDEDGLYKIIQYEPLGVCAGICAWNGSHLQTSWKAAPAVAAGNTFILKSSEKTPIAVNQYGELFNQAGFPPGVLNIVTGGGKVGSALASHMDIARIGFTGSVATGRAVQIAAAKSNLKVVTLELGGKSASMIFNDANIPNAVFHSCTSFLRNSGQVCVAASRALVQEDIADKFIKALKEAFDGATRKLGDPTLAETAFGPLADRQHFNRVLGYVQEAKAEGIEVLAGGERNGNQGTFLKPTVLLNPGLKSKVYTEEIFGPVLCVRTFKNEEEAISLANDTRFGLGGKSSEALQFISLG